MMHLLVLMAIAAAPAAAPVDLLVDLLVDLDVQHNHAHDRAQHAMGFDQQKTTHHFRLEADGGTIEVTVKDKDKGKDVSDRVVLDQIRSHLAHITEAFRKGDFSLPFLVHATEPPGVPVMKARRTAITYRLEELPAGAQVIIRTSDAAARSAIHDFLRFQIREHRTGDPLVLPDNAKSR